jgi:hypothetical protein
MKKLIIAAAFILLAGVAFGQTLQKGSILALHVISVDLDPDVTFNQWENFGLTKIIPALNKEFQGDVELYYAKVDRGDDENGLSLIWLFKSAEVRAKYFTQEGDGTELFNSKYEKILQSLAEEMSKIGTSTYSRVHYNDWIIQ